ncbi:uncharacterized protein [Ptychodera flava]|uniref:uncharacterized protein n=1 Tax=Ptychodera flava TaxID=63121 RepID=UPI00396A2B37
MPSALKFTSASRFLSASTTRSCFKTRKASLFFVGLAIVTVFYIFVHYRNNEHQRWTILPTSEPIDERVQWHNTRTYSRNNLPERMENVNVLEMPALAHDQNDIGNVVNSTSSETSKGKPVKHNVCPGSLTMIRTSSQWFRLRYLPDVPVFLTEDNVYPSLTSDYPPFGIKGVSVEEMKKLLRILPDLWMYDRQSVEGKQCIHCTLTTESQLPSPRRDFTSRRYVQHIHYRFNVDKLPASDKSHPWKSSFVVTSVNGLEKFKTNRVNGSIQGLENAEKVILILIVQKSHGDWERIKQWIKWHATDRTRSLANESNGAQVIISEVRIIHPDFLRYIRELYVENVIDRPSREFITSILTFHICDYVRIHGNFFPLGTVDYSFEGQRGNLMNRIIVEEKVFEKMEMEGLVKRDTRS